jgi:hypothetical protein
MESLQIIYWKDLIEKIQTEQIPQNISIDFKDEQIPYKDVALLNRFGFRVPENLVYYDDQEIDFSDDADIIDDDLKTGKISWTLRSNFNVEPEIKEWIQSEKIELNALIPKLLKNYFDNLKRIGGKAAF